MTSRGKVVVADDEPDIRHMVSDILRDAGFETTEAADGAEVLQLLAKEKYDLVILDIFMPVNGLHALEGIKSNHPGVKVIILSAITQYDKNFNEAVIGKAADAFVAKPPRLEEFVAVVDAVIEGREVPHFAKRPPASLRSSPAG